MKYRSQTNKVGKVLLIAASIVFSCSALAANTLTTGVKVTKIDATTYNGDIKVQTAPRPNIAGLACSSDFWLILRADSANYKQLLAALLTAKAADFTVSIGADDTNLTGNFCELSRFIVD